MNRYSILLCACTITCTLVGPPKTLDQQHEQPSEKLSILFQVVAQEIKILQQENLWQPVVTVTQTTQKPTKKGSSTIVRMFEKEVVEQELEQIRKTPSRYRTAKKCPLCENSYKQRSELIRHLHYHHEHHNRPHVCPYCSEGFVRADRFQKHLRTHEDE